MISSIVLIPAKTLTKIQNRQILTSLISKELAPASLLLGRGHSHGPSRRDTLGRRRRDLTLNQPWQLAPSSCTELCSHFSLLFYAPTENAIPALPRGENISFCRGTLRQRDRGVPPGQSRGERFSPGGSALDLRPDGRQELPFVCAEGNPHSAALVPVPPSPLAALPVGRVSRAGGGQDRDPAPAHAGCCADDTMGPVPSPSPQGWSSAFPGQLLTSSPLAALRCSCPRAARAPLAAARLRAPPGFYYLYKSLGWWHRRQSLQLCR